MTPCVRILCLCLCVVESARIRIHQDDVTEASAKEKVTHDSSSVEEKSRALLEEGCKFDKMPEDNSKKLGSLLEEPKDNSSAFVPASEVGPDDYWSAEKALGRCRTAKSWRTAKVVIGAPLMLVAGQFVLMSYNYYGIALPSDIGVVLRSALKPALNLSLAVATTVIDGVVVPVVNNVVVPVVTNVVVPVVNALSTGTMRRAAVAVGTTLIHSVPWATAGLVFSTMFFYMYTFFIYQYLTFAVPSVLVDMLQPFILVLGAVEGVSSMSVDLAAKFLGHGPTHPSCCCAPVALLTTSAPTTTAHATAAWNPNTMCGDYSAGSRAKWLMDNRGMSEAAARDEVMKEFPSKFTDVALISDGKAPSLET